MDKMLYYKKMRYIISNGKNWFKFTSVSSCILSILTIDDSLIFYKSIQIRHKFLFNVYTYIYILFDTYVTYSSIVYTYIYIYIYIYIWYIFPPQLAHPTLFLEYIPLFRLNFLGKMTDEKA